MTRFQERLLRMQDSASRRLLRQFEADLAAWTPEPPAGISPTVHQAYRNGLVSAVDDLRRDLGIAPPDGAATANTTVTHEARG